MTKEIGTLKELNVKPGDVVESMSGTEIWPRGLQTFTEEGWVFDGEGDSWGPNAKIGLYPMSATFRIVSRASEVIADTPKLWKDMTPEEKGALLLAEHEGKVIEYGYNGSDFCRVKPNDGKWVDGYNYRVKPEPVVEENEIRHYNERYGWYRITFDLVDGKPDCNSVKMESL